jgi:hypothetical protein
VAKPQKTGPKAIKAQDTAMRALELRKAGATYEAIAQMMGYSSKSTAFNAVNRLMTSTKREGSREAFEMELRRLDDLLMALWPAARQGELPAIDRTLRIMESRRKLLGLDAPVQTQTQIQQIIRVSYEEVTYQPVDFEQDVELPQLTEVSTDNENGIEYEETDDADTDDTDDDASIDD